MLYKDFIVAVIETEKKDNSIGKWEKLMQTGSCKCHPVPVTFQGAP